MLYIYGMHEKIFTCEMETIWLRHSQLITKNDWFWSFFFWVSCNFRHSASMLRILEMSKEFDFFFFFKKTQLEKQITKEIGQRSFSILQDLTSQSFMS